MNDISKSQLTTKLKIWLDSKEGQQCRLPFRVPNPGVASAMMQDRLTEAFLAGTKAGVEIQQEIIDDLEGRLADALDCIR